MMMSPAAEEEGEDYNRVEFTSSNGGVSKMAAIQTRTRGREGQSGRGIS